MGIDFVGHGKFALNWPDWRAIYDLACDFGWQPEGTIDTGAAWQRVSVPAGSSAGGTDTISSWLVIAETFPLGRFEHSLGYFTNDGQLVTKEDAAALALALRRALTRRSADPTSLPEITDSWASMIKEFIAYCDKGEFRIDLD